MQTTTLEAFPHALLANPRAAEKDVLFPQDLQRVVDLEGFAAALQAITAWPGYAPTPLAELPGLAGGLGLGGIWYKDEGGRFGLGSFKALGGAYAIMRHLQREIAQSQGQAPTPAALIAGAYRDQAASVTVTTATDGNHGRSVAWGARLFGCRAVIYIHADVSPGRAAAIASLGAEVRRVPGNYDDSVRQAAADAAANGWQVISDTTWPGYESVPRDVMHGYGVMFSEIFDQAPDTNFTHIFIQAGVGALPAALAGYFWQRLQRRRPRLIVVEPDAAACHFASAALGKPTPVRGRLETLMAGLACGEVSPLAWALLDRAAFAFMKVPDAAAVAAMRLLSAGASGDPRIVGGESAVGGLAGLLAAAADTAARRLLGLDEHARILLIGSEGATDPVLYQALTGVAAAEIAAA